MTEDRPAFFSLADSFSYKEKAILLVGLRVGVSLVVVVGMTLIRLWLQANPVQTGLLGKSGGFELVAAAAEILLLVVSLLSLFLLTRVRFGNLAIALSALDFAYAAGSTHLAIAVVHPEAPVLLVLFFRFGLITFFGIPALTVVFGRWAFATAFGYLAANEIFILALSPRGALGNPAVLTVPLMQSCLFAFLTYGLGYASNLAQTFHRRARGLALREKSLRLEREALASELSNANRLRQEFLAYASHELRTPLQVVLGYAVSLVNGFCGPLKEEIKDEAGKILSETERLSGLVDDLLELSRLQSGKTPLALEEFNLMDCIKEAGKEKEKALGSKGIILEIESQDGEVALTADYGLLRRFFLILLEYCAGRLQNVKIGFSGRRNADRVQVDLVVPGIHELADSQHFTEQVELFLASQLAAHHDSSFEISSREPDRTRFSISIPIEPPETPVRLR